MRRLTIILIVIIIGIFTLFVFHQNSKSSVGKKDFPSIHNAEVIDNQDTLEKNLVEGKTLNERLEILKTNLHTTNSGAEAKKYFPDFTSVYVEHSTNPYLSAVSPFTYYYTQEADKTVAICNIGLTVFICSGKIDNVLEESDYNKCQITDAYLHPENFIQK